MSLAGVVALMIVFVPWAFPEPLPQPPAPACTAVGGDVAALLGDALVRRGNDDPAVPTFAATPGSLRITAPPGSDVRTEQGRITAPSLLVPVDGDFVLETEIDLVPLVAYQAAGLLVMRDVDDYVRLERGIGDFDAVALEFSRDARHVKVHGPFRGDPQPIRTETVAVGLRLVRTGETVRASWRDVAADGQWRALSGEVPFAGPASVGVAVLNTGAAADAENFAVSVRRLSLTCGSST
ncbi:hypothetical protein [Actinomycetospora flava]|uniref:DUF1349 domain-containing protein n=1 Tax=Actinomycetospora flava TaxID=3129232 RepID=A0ABU8M819_9PSEU